MSLSHSKKLVAAMKVRKDPSKKLYPMLLEVFGTTKNGRQRAKYECKRILAIVDDVIANEKLKQYTKDSLKRV